MELMVAFQQDGVSTSGNVCRVDSVLLIAESL